MNIINDVYGQNPKPPRQTAKRRFAKSFQRNDEVVNQVGDNMERQATAENTMTNEQLHQLQSKNK